MPATTEIAATETVATIDAEEFETAYGDSRTQTFWSEVDAYEQHLRDSGLDHAPVGFAL